MIRRVKNHACRDCLRAYTMHLSSPILAIHLQFAHGCAITTHAHIMFRTLLSIVSLALASSATLAQTPLPAEFVSCSRIQTNGERLACYDRAVAYLSEPAGTKAAAPTPETSFGLQASVPQPPAAAVPAEAAKSEEVSSITARVTEITSDREGKKVVALDNGQTWRELGKTGFITLKTGDEVTISRAALGSFMMSVPNGKPLRVRRVK
jgi:hypothetical protein